ncbi:hypothetical protein RCH06_003592, partial [Polaromonas sp. CG_9.5]|uniref:relaxase/mobilization nuclease domain-containing protein n=1 Tax=Polaromonas sp. CG_9.5 TaxID=3071705 RepID=UPI002DF79ED3|nr:hypothetical protein [Polaromonas sp. CG_9.5]
MKGMQKISRGSGFKGVLSYAFEGKDQEVGHGRLLGGSMAGTTARELAAEFRAIARLRPDIARPVWHNSLRMPAGEDISDARWNAIATSYLKRMRFDVKHTQYAVFKHDDAHVHLVVNRVMTDGSVFLGRNENLLSTKVIQRLEHAFKLTLTPGPTYSAEGKIVMPERSKPSKNELEQALRLGELPARLALQARVATALQGRPTTGEFLARLDAAGVQAVPNIASTGRMNGFSFEWDGIAFTGSQLGAAYKWAAIEKEIQYDQAGDSQELARRQAEARHRRADGAAAKPAGDAASEPSGVAAAAGAPAAAAQRAAAGDLDAGSGDLAAGAGVARTRSAGSVLDSDGPGSAAPGNRGDIAPESAGPVAASGERGNYAVSGEDFEGRDGQPRDAGQGFSAGRPGASEEGGQRGAFDRANAARAFEEIAQLALRQDEDTKREAWRLQAAALSAPGYRLTLTDSLQPWGGLRPDPLGTGQSGDEKEMREAPAQSYSAEEVAALIPELCVCSARGFDVYLTPVDEAHHYLVVQGVRPERLAGLRAQGYRPALVQQSGEGDVQVVLKTSRDGRQNGEDRLVDTLALALNQEWASQNAPADTQTGRQRALPMAGFALHAPGKSESNAKSEKRSALTVILEALGQFCKKTLKRLTALRRQSDHDGKRPPSTRIEIQDSVWWSHWLISATSNAAGS